MVAVRFWVGEAMEPSIVKLYQKVMANLERMPPGVRPPLIQRKGIDDVPILNLTLWSEAMDDAALRDLGLAFAAALPMIYFLLVMELRDFRIPLIIVAPIPIPLTLLGIVPVPPDHRPGPGGRLRGNPDRSHPFQGMAVSLLFGVLVVTLLRL
jgi:multidrug efflux pump subunit AcrB